VVTDIVPVGQWTEKDLLLLVGAVEVGSEHPLARAIIERTKTSQSQLPDVKNFEAIAGMGVRGQINDKDIAVGNIAFMNSLGVLVEEQALIVEKLQNQAKTVVYAVINKEIAGLMALADTLKPHATEAIAALKKMNKEIIMITGDNPKTAQAIARELGINKVLAQVLPQQKADVIKKLQEGGKIVAMVGDGINDSPALAQADIGIAIGSGTDVAIETGEIVLVKDDLRDVVTAIELSGKTIKKIWQNLFWAFVYNVVAIPIAGGLHLIFTQSSFGVAAPWIVSLTKKLGKIGAIILSFSQTTLRPEIAGFAMAFSSVSVVINSLLLRRYVPPMEKRKIL
jgi:Cu+-exporting ATPase